MALITRLAACAAIALIAAPAYAQVVDAGFETVQQEADAIRAYQDSVAQTRVTVAPVTQTYEFPMAKTYSSAEEAIAASQPIQIEIFDTPVPAYESTPIYDYGSSVTTASAPITSTIQTTESATYTYPAQTQPVGVIGSGSLHVVAKGDTLFNIGQRYGLKPSDIMNANGLTGSNIQLGQNLTIPAGQALTTTYVDTEPYTAPVTTAATTIIRNEMPVPGQSSTYRVLPGDTLYSIARHCGTTAGAIATASGISTSGILSPGQALTLPAGYCAR